MGGLWGEGSTLGLGGLHCVEEFRISVEGMSGVEMLQNCSGVCMGGRAVSIFCSMRPTGS